MRFLVYADRGLIDANLPTFAALRERLRQLLHREPSGMSDVYVLVFDRRTDDYVGRWNVLVDGREPVLVGPRSAALA